MQERRPRRLPAIDGVLWTDQFLDGQQRENRSFSRVTIASRLIPIGFRVPAVYLKPAF